MLVGQIVFASKRYPCTYVCFIPAYKRPVTISFFHHTSPKGQIMPWPSCHNKLSPLSWASGSKHVKLTTRPPKRIASMDCSDFSLKSPETVTCGISRLDHDAAHHTNAPFPTLAHRGLWYLAHGPIPRLSKKETEIHQGHGLLFIVTKVQPGRKWSCGILVPSRNL